MRAALIRPPALDAADYYRDPDIRARVLEYAGAGATHEATAAYLAGLAPIDGGRPTWSRAIRVPPGDVDQLLSRGLDVSRSLWDTASLIFILDLDHLNVDHPGEPFLHPADVFLKVEPVYQAARRVLAALGLRAQSVMTGRGYHFAGQIPLRASIVDRLASLAATPAWFATVDARRPPRVTAPLTERQARAAAGLGLATEYLAHQILEASRDESPLPVVFNGTIVGSGLSGRECISIDFSHAGDPLDTRHLRTAFSTYSWHHLRPDLLGPAAAAAMPVLAAVPRDRRSLVTLATTGRQLEAARHQAAITHAVLPVVTKGIEMLVARYAVSGLAEFHRTFAAERTALGDRVPPLDIARVPPCVSWCLTHPNDLLLKPEHVQHLVRELLSRGWKAAEIAALVESRYRGDYGWCDRWTQLEPRTRADFDVRTFAGLVATGADRMVDFNCVSAQEKGLCPSAGCPYDLRRDRERLIRRDE